MEDEKIIELYFKRDENAIKETSAKYEKYLYAIAYNILTDNEDSEESVNDTYLGAWNTIPPQKPRVFPSFLGKITRNISLNKWRRKNAKKRGNNEFTLVFEEIEESIPSSQNVFKEIEDKELAEIINRFLSELPKNERSVFICRYWYFDSLEDIEKQFSFGKSKVKSMLYRIRKKLLAYLKKEGVFIEQ